MNVNKMDLFDTLFPVYEVMVVTAFGLATGTVIGWIGRVIWMRYKQWRTLRRFSKTLEAYEKNV